MGMSEEGTTPNFATLLTYCDPSDFAYGKATFSSRNGHPFVVCDDISPNRGVTFQGRQDIHPPAFCYRQLVAPLGEMSRSDRGVVLSSALCVLRF